MPIPTKLMTSAINLVRAVEEFSAEVPAYIESLTDENFAEASAFLSLLHFYSGLFGEMADRVVGRLKEFPSAIAALESFVPGASALMDYANEDGSTNVEGLINSTSVAEKVAAKLEELSIA